MFMDSALEEFVAPSNLITIGDGCFKGCSKLKKFDLSKVKTKLNIPRLCFSSCEKLTEFDFSKCYAIGSNAFLRSGIKKAIFDFSNVQNESNNEENISNDLSEPQNNVICSFAFSESQLEYLEIKGKVRLNKSCFANCRNLIKVKLDINTIKELPEYAFCYDKNLTEITGVENVERVGIGCFIDCSLASLDNFAKLNIIEESAFSGNKFESITINAFSIEPRAFSYCKNLKRVIFTSSKLKQLEFQTFYMSGIEYVDIGKTSISTICYDMFKESPLSEIRLPRHLKTIRAGAFAKTKLAQIKIPASVNCIESAAFECCDNLKIVEWPENCKSISQNTFKMCCNLETFLGAENIEKIYYGAFQKTAVNLILPNLNYLGKDAFNDYTGTLDRRASSILIDKKQLPDNVLLPYFYE